MVKSSIWEGALYSSLMSAKLDIVVASTEVGERMHWSSLISNCPYPSRA